MKYPQRTRVKICGITSVEDGLAVAQNGADAIGLVFYEPSPRHVSIEQAQVIAQAMPAFVTKTALFVNPTVEYVNAVLAAVPLDLLQFHGDETPAFCEQFQRSYIKAVRMQTQTDLARIAVDYAKSAGLLLDAYKEGIPGGTGEQFNWALVPKVFTKPIILAGGLTPENVQLAIGQVKPWAVDVSGGVEATKGVKDTDKIQQFMQQVMSRIE